MTMFEWLMVAAVLAMTAVMFLQRINTQKKMRHLHRNISYSAQVIEMEVGSINISKAALGVAAKLLRASTETTRQFVSGKGDEFAVSPMDSAFARNAILGSVLPIDCRIVEPCDWENGILRAIIELPAKIHERDACITTLNLGKFLNNPVVLDPADFGQSLPIGQADAKPSEGVGVALEIKLNITDRAVQMRDELKSRRFSVCAYVRVSSIATVCEVDESGRLLCSGELIALQPFLNRAEQATTDVASK